MSKQPPRLGRGLSSLISSDLRLAESSRPVDSPSPEANQIPTSLPTPSATRVLMVAVTSVRNNPAQPRKTFHVEQLNSLAESIKRNGTLQPIIVRPAGSGYELVAGERRLRAASLAGLAEIPAVVRPVRDDEMLELALIENIQRSDLNPIERARAYHSLTEKHGLSHEQIASKTGEDRATVANYIRLLSLSEEIQDMVASGDLSTGHAKAILGISDIILQYKLAQNALQGKWSVRQMEAAVAKTRKAPDAGSAPDQRPAVRDVEQRLSAALGTRVRIHEGRKRHTGRVVVEYYNLDDFERITARLGLTNESA